MICTFLHTNRNTDHSDTRLTPFELMFARQPSLRWKSLNPSEPDNEVFCSKNSTSNMKKFSIGDTVYVKNFMKNKWQVGKIVEFNGFNIFMVIVGDKKYKRHADHLSVYVTPENNDNIDETTRNDTKKNIKESYKDILNKKLSMPSNACRTITNDNVIRADNIECEDIDQNSFEEENISNNENVLVCSRKSKRTTKKPIKLNL